MLLNFFKKIFNEKVKTIQYLSLTEKRFVTIANDILIVPDNTFWTADSVYIDNKRSWSFYNEPQFNNFFLRGIAIKEDDNIYFEYNRYAKKQTINSLKVSKYKSNSLKFDLESDLTNFPYYFEPGFQISCKDENVTLRVLEYKIAKENWGQEKSDLDKLIESYGGIDKYLKHINKKQ